jgi:hypothetical protein
MYVTRRSLSRRAENAIARKSYLFPLGCDVLGYESDQPDISEPSGMLVFGRI